jgi:hypothetical protein
MAAALVGALGLAGCASDSVEPQGSAAAPSSVPTFASVQWDRLPDPPLSPRLAAIVVALDDRLLVVGGDDGAPCPPTADCAGPRDPSQDGAIYDPATREWSPIADAPIGLDDGNAAVVVGSKLYVLDGGSERQLISYDPTSDAWTRLEPGDHARYVNLVALGDLVAVVSGTREEGDPTDQVYDPATDTWTDLPPDPLGASFDRVLTDTPTGAILTAKESVPHPGSAAPAIVLAAQLSPDHATWKRLPDSDLIGGYRWAWTGQRMVDPTLGEADGGEVGNWGRSVPFGGRFDPATQTWSRLPGAPKGYSKTGWKVEALGGPVSAAGGWFYDDRSGRWSKLLRPDGAPEYAGSAAWVGDTLFVVGGQFEASGAYALSAGAWALTVDAT